MNSDTYRAAVERGRDVISNVGPDTLRTHYAAKFVVAFVLVILLIAAVGTANFVQAQDAVESDASAQLQSTAELQADSIAGWVTNLKTQVRSTSSTEAVQSRDPSRIYGELEDARRGAGMGVQQIHYVDVEAGTVTTSTNAAVRGDDLADVEQPWADAAALRRISGQEAAVVGGSFASGGMTDRRVAFASQVPGQNDRYVVLVGSVDDQIERLSQPTADHATAIVDGETGTVVSATGDGVDVTPAAYADVAGTTVERADDHVTAATPVAGTDWVLVTTVPTDTAFAVSDTIGRYVLLIVMTGLLGLGAVGVVLGRQTIPPLIDLREQARRMEDGDLAVDLGTERRDEIGRLYGAFASMRDSLREQIERAETARTEAERERQRTEETNRHLVEKADAYSRTMAAVADGDLTRRMDPESDNEAMAEIAEEFNAMIADLERTTASLQSFATDVAAASQEVTASGEEVRETSEQVAESIQSISVGADRQYDQLRTVQDESKELSATIEEITSLSSEVADIAERTAETGREGQAAAAEAIDGLGEIEAESDEAVAAIEALHEEIEAVDELVEIISDITDQTNVLALNATIEAARAGDSGDGFEVVANEVKELAEHTQEAAADIEDRIETVQAHTERAATEVRRTSERIGENAADVERALSALDEIAENAEETHVGVREISEATDQQSRSTERVVSMVIDAATISEETSDEAETVAAAAEEQTGALDEVTRSMDGLSTRAIRLDELLSDFRTDVDAGTPETPPDRVLDDRRLTTDGEGRS